MTIFFTSDTHFNHVNILDYCPNRTVLGNSLEEMNEGLIRLWNETVSPEDEVYHLGDFAMGKRTLHKGFFERLNGRKYLVRGNHDGTTKKMLEMGFEEVHNNFIWGRGLLSGEMITVYMSHIPLGADTYSGRYYPPELIQEVPPHDIYLHGHVHNGFKRRGKYINVGVDVWNLRPVTFEQLIQAEDELARTSVEDTK